MSVDTGTPISEFHLQMDRMTSRDPFVAMEPFHELPPFWCDDHGGFWVVTRYQDVRELLQDAHTFSSVDAMVPQISLSGSVAALVHRPAVHPKASQRRPSPHDT